MIFEIIGCIAIITVAIWFEKRFDNSEQGRKLRQLEREGVIPL